MFFSLIYSVFRFPEAIFERSRLVLHVIVYARARDLVNANSEAFQNKQLIFFQLG